MSRPPLRWRDLPGSLRALGFWLTVVQLAGYTTSLVFVWHTTRLIPRGVAEHYRGTDPARTDLDMKFAKSFTEMLTVTHTHLLAMAVIFVLSGLALALCERPAERWKRFLIAEPMVALLVSFGAMWLMRYAHPGFSLLLSLSSAVMAMTFYLQCGLVLREFWNLRREGR
ncbi:MAG TPA: hypothetical protein VNJ71_02215 [Gemmatimonadales bacterium]|nr:hypothetical protein [Gemmatimonadales bacterium]